MNRPAPNPEEAIAVASLGAAAGSGEADALIEALDAAGGTLDPDDVEELLLQTYLFAGFPRTINAFFTWQRWAAGHDGRGAMVMEPDDPEGWRERGEALCRVIYDGSYDALQKRLARLHPAIALWTLVEGYGKVLSRPGPDPARRELAAVGVLIVLGAERQLGSHLLGALHAGVPREALEAAVAAVAERWDRSSMVEPLLAGLPG
ncbi:MAG: carboxymuconolactone decarboxylase family protein [Gemmatimonadetes bacterium]|nr:carboxymuconolactone decarboxylase family protein [Gemmatimonadota bacterium]